MFIELFLLHYLLHYFIIWFTIFTLTKFETLLKVLLNILIIIFSFQFNSFVTPFNVISFVSFINNPFLCKYFLLFAVKKLYFFLIIPFSLFFVNTLHPFFIYYFIFYYIFFDNFHFILLLFISSDVFWCNYCILVFTKMFKRFMKVPFSFMKVIFCRILGFTLKKATSIVDLCFQYCISLLFSYPNFLLLLIFL